MSADISAEAERIRRFNRAAVEGEAPIMAWPLFHALRFFTGDGARPFIGKNSRLLEFMGFENDPAIRRRLKRALRWLEEWGWMERWKKLDGRSGSHRLMVLTKPGAESVLTPQIRAGLDGADWDDLVYEFFGWADGKMIDNWLEVLESLAIEAEEEVSQTSPLRPVEVSSTSPQECPRRHPGVSSTSPLNPQEPSNNGASQPPLKDSGNSLGKKSEDKRVQSEIEHVFKDPRLAKAFKELTGQPMPASPASRARALNQWRTQELAKNPTAKDRVDAALLDYLTAWSAAGGAD